MGTHERTGNRDTLAKLRRSQSEPVVLIEPDENTSSIVARRLRRLGYDVTVRRSLGDGDDELIPDVLTLVSVTLLAASAVSFRALIHLGNDTPGYVSLGDVVPPANERLGAAPQRSPRQTLERRFSQNFRDLSQSRTAVAGPGPIHVDDLVLDIRRLELTRSGRAHALRPQEASLLAVLVRHSCEALSYRFIAEQAWPSDAHVTALNIAVHVRWLREKIEDDPSVPSRIRTIRGYGYSYRPPS